LYGIIRLVALQDFCLQCFDTVGWVAGRASGLYETEWWGTSVVSCLEQGTDLHMAQLMPQPLTVSCFSKIQIAFIFLVPAHPVVPDNPVVPDKAPLNGCVCVRACVRAYVCVHHYVLIVINSIFSFIMFQSKQLFAVVSDRLLVISVWSQMKQCTEWDQGIQVC